MLRSGSIIFLYNSLENDLETTAFAVVPLSDLLLGRILEIEKLGKFLGDIGMQRFLRRFKHRPSALGCDPSMFGIIREHTVPATWFLSRIEYNLV